MNSGRRRNRRRRRNGDPQIPCSMSSDLEAAVRRSGNGEIGNRSRAHERPGNRGSENHAGPPSHMAEAVGMPGNTEPGNRSRVHGRPGNCGAQNHAVLTNQAVIVAALRGRRGNRSKVHEQPVNAGPQNHAPLPNFAVTTGKSGNAEPGKRSETDRCTRKVGSQHQAVPPNLISAAGMPRNHESGNTSKAHGLTTKNDPRRQFALPNLTQVSENVEIRNHSKVSHVIQPMTHSRIEKLLEKNDPVEILLTLNFDDNGFFSLLRSLSKGCDKFNLIAAIIDALGIASRYDRTSNLAAFLNKVVCENNFEACILSFLVHLQRHNHHEKHVRCLPSLLIFLQKVHRSLPKASLAYVKLILDNLIFTLEVMDTEAKKAPKSQYQQCQDDLRMMLITNVNAFGDEFRKFVKQQEKVTDTDRQKNAYSDSHQMRQPPNNFREIPLFPQVEDLDDVERPFLRKNIIQGRYENVEHYLDVQYRLLREDFIQPLREGISEYRRIQSRKQASRLHNMSFQVYMGVRVEKTVLQDIGMLHVIKFNTDKLKHVRWESSKRLLQGSLLCLSSDNFQTMLFATVANRKVEDLTKGRLEIQFATIDSNTFKFDPSVSFTMVESEAYFEAYRHTLLTLQTFDAENFPLKEYIVETKADVGIPSYISTDIYEAFVKIQDKKKLKDVSFSVAEKWLSKTVETFDNAQMQAFKSALTKTFSVIQGPPGPGKTFIGLKIVESLLQDLNYWNVPDRFPIMLVCYSNHALDQFIEGVSRYTEKIVRIGGRCQNPALQKYTLREIRERQRSNKKISPHVHRSFRHCCKLKKDIASEIKSVCEQIEEATKDVFNLVELEEEGVISKLHLQQLQNIQRNLNSDDLEKDVFRHWLDTCNLRQILKGPKTNPCVLAVQNNEHLPPESLGGADSDLEDYDVEYFQNTRTVEDHNDFQERYEIYLGKGFAEYEIADDEEGWKIQGGRNGAQQCIRFLLRNEDRMTENEAEGVQDVMSLAATDRWRLYRFWVHKFVEKKEERLNELQKDYLETANIYRELQQEEDVDLIRGAQIVGMTTTGAAKYRFLVARLKPKIVVVEEAAEVLEAHIVTSLTKDTRHLILIGDHQQLRPTTTVYQLAKKFHLDISLFERMIKNGMDHDTLCTQHRMRPCISSLLVPSIYPNLKNAKSLIDADDQHILGVVHDMFFVTHCIPEETNKEGRSYSNKHEATFLVELCNYLILQGYLPSQITILTMYSGQLLAINQEIKKKKSCKGVKATVVDNYQGEENDIILLSFVRSNTEAKAGFLKTDNRICVALSRARRGLYCIGDFEMLSDASPLWNNILSKAKSESAFGSSLILQCQNHPKNEILVSTAKDFKKKVPEGGCTQSCDFQLSCGHVCPRLCHSYDREHKKSECRKDCFKIIASCHDNHRCPKSCHFPDECPPCTLLVQKYRKSCGHEVPCPCSMDPESRIIPCLNRCKKILPCDHQCRNFCTEECETNCSEEIEVNSPCGHKVKIPCFKRNVVEYAVRSCTEPCGTELPCGHLCEGTCSTCYQKRMHKPCASPCNRTLVCGHECNAPCAEGCPPCLRKCENRCIHSRCQKLCSEPCIPCQEKCGWSCMHKKCDRLCHEPCSRIPCDEPCMVLLKCGHPCIGLCGEPCPKKCRICDHDEVTEIFFGSEDEPNARFVKLEDCEHVIEVGGMTQWMDQKDSEIQLKRCPKCKTPIRKNVRYKGIIRRSIQNIEKVKENVRGSQKEIDRKRRELLGVINDVFQTNSRGSLRSPKHQVLEKINLEKILVRLREILEDSPDGLSLARLTHYENYIAFFDRILTEVEHVIKEKEGNTINPVSIPAYTVKIVNSDDCLQIRNFFFTRAKEIVEFVLKYFNAANEFLLKDVSNEIVRLEYLSTAIQLRQKMPEVNEKRGFISKMFSLFDGSDKNSRAFEHYRRALLQVTKLAPLGEEEHKLFKNSLENVQDLTQIAVTKRLGIIERNMIVKAMNLLPGHWFECPNGHIYCITECGGAMEEGRCNTCGAAIGGHSHNLRSDNRHNSEMDGSRYPAWSEQANLENFDLNELL